MKKLLPLFLFCLSIVAFSQDTKRELIEGKVIVEGNDIEGITVYNSSTQIGTVTDMNGEFKITVAIDDLIEIRALEYQNFDVRINNAILESKKINVYLIEEINRLEEVRITNKELTGNINADINMVETFIPKQNAIYFGIKSKNTNILDDESLKPIDNIAVQGQGQSMENGLNVKNIVDQLLIPLFRSEVKDKKAVGVPEVPAEAIKYYLGSNFLVDNFDIPEHRVEEFIRYVEAESFDFDLLNYGHEMEFLELLNSKSKTFLND